VLGQNSGNATAITTHKDDDQSSIKAIPNSTATAAPTPTLPLQPNPTPTPPPLHLALQHRCRTPPPGRTARSQRKQLHTKVTAMTGKAVMMKRNMIEKQTIAYQDHETDQLLLPPGFARCDPTETLRSQAATSAARAGLFSKAS
jgi:hypothetical protein